MKRLDSVTIQCGGDARSLELWQGDLAAIPPEEAVDVLVVSAFPGDYLLVPGTTIGALAAKGLSVGRLAEDKYQDLRETQYLRTAELPEYMRCWQYLDCREADEAKVHTACAKLIAQLPARAGLRTPQGEGGGRP